MNFSKYHALGNDYLVIEPGELPDPFEAEQVQRICHRHFGLGSDGILVGPLPSQAADFGLRIFNPDGSEAEKSGNGLRIFARALWDRGRVGSEPFTVETRGGFVLAQVLERGHMVQVEMGRVSFWSSDIPITGPAREVLDEEIVIEGQRYRFCAASLGNPHCVLFVDQPTPELARRVGPQVERHAWFPRRTNVQFVCALDRETLQLEIWERGAGYTLASGSSASAATAAAQRLGFCNQEVMVQMPGGNLRVQLSRDFDVTITGPVTRVAEGVSFDELWM